MPEIEFTSQAQIFGFAARMCQWAQVHLRTAILQNDPRWISRAIIALHFPIRHTYYANTRTLEGIMNAYLSIARFLTTRDWKHILDAIKNLEFAEREFWVMARQAPFQRMEPQPPTLGAFYPGVWANLDRALMEYLPGIAVGWLAVSIFYPLARGGKFLQLVRNRAAIQQAVEQIYQQTGPVIRREAPELWRLIQDLVRSIRLPPR
jgi:hypothetical protein